jgi:DNA repair exonuclease SbcCD nuclease subunit
LKFCQTADWHITTRTGYAQVRLDYISDNVNLLVDEGKRNHIDFFVLLGDIFNVVNPPEEDRLFFAKQVTKMITVAPVYIIPGNHDGNDKYSAFSSLGELVNDKRLIIINKPCILGMYGYKVCFLPYSSKLPKYILKARGKYIDVLFSHFSLIGAKVSKENFKLKSWIDSKLLTEFKYVGLGDIHKGQQINNCYYSGSINKVNFGEVAEKKHFLVVNLCNE